MPITRAELVERLAACPADELAETLRAAGLEPALKADSHGMSLQLVRALWWRTHTPLGGLVLPDTLDRIVDRVVRRAGLQEQVAPADVELRLQALVQAVVPTRGFSRENDQLTHTDPDLQERLKKGTPWASLAGVGVAGGSAGARLASLQLLKVAAGPVGRVLPFVPKVGPAFLAIRGAAGTVAMVSGPVGVILSIASLNAAFGAAYDRALPLLLAVGLLLQPRHLITGPVAAPAPS